MPTRTEAISRFLKAKTHLDLAEMYTPAMECQVNVAQDGGYRIDREFKGQSWQAWTDGIQQWKSFRIPHNASTNPEYEDREMSYDLVAHAEGIGMTGWDWQNRLSRWFGYDFDAISGHSERHRAKLSNEDLKHIQDLTIQIPWVTVRRSTGGKGLHLYVVIEPVSTANHTEHAAIGRAILGKMSALTGYDFSTKVDNCGSNMWVWHRKMDNNPDGLLLIKRGTVLEEVPINWRDHIRVVSGRRSRTIPKFVGEINPEGRPLEDSEKTEQEKLFEELTSQRPKIPLDEGHRRLLRYLLEDNKTGSWWDSDHHMLVTHTYQLGQAHGDLGLRGVFKTVSEHDDGGTDHNCFAFPLRRGAWVIRRYGPGIAEAPTWSQDAAGYTRCLYNHEPDLRTAARAYGGMEQTKGGYDFRELEVALNAAKLLGVNIDIPNDYAWARTRPASLRTHKDGRLVITFERKPTDQLPGWNPEKDKWVRIVDVQTSTPQEQEPGNYDDLVRHIVNENGDDYGWVIKSEGHTWHTEPLRHITSALKAHGLNSKDSEVILGQCVRRPWQLVNMPFREEYPGDRRWNRNAAQFRFLPNPNIDSLRYPHWSKVLAHCGKGLDQAIAKDGWCKANGILTGADYLKVWLASVFQYPLEPLPYLFFHGNQDNGKSSFHEAFGLLVTRGYERADNALVNPQGFNAELEGAILCVIEEVNLNDKQGRGGIAYNRMKDYVTARSIPIHRKGQTPYLVQNSTHWVHCANLPDFCPIFPGDTRVTMIQVPDLDPSDLIPKRALMASLKAEGPDILADLLQVQIPTPTGRLNLPVIATEEKIATQQSNRTAIEVFFDEKGYNVPGEMELYSLVWDKFQEYVDPQESHQWTQKRFGRELPKKFVKGRNRKDGQYNIGNFSFTPPNGHPRKKRLTTYTDERNQTFLVPDEADKEGQSPGREGEKSEL